MNYTLIIMYLSFYGLIGLTIWFTKNPWVLLALVFTPSYHFNDNKEDEKEDKEESVDETSEE